MLRSSTVIVVCALFAVTFSYAAELPRDPNNTYGQFDNGMKYIVRKTPNPPGKMTLFLHIDTGALNETDAQNGLAHFIEHMAFNGSEHYPPGKLIPLLSTLGMTFGADTNAHTNQRETVYKLTLPDNKPETLETALTILSDYASTLQLGQEQIDNERGVILEELRARKSVAQRMRKEMTGKLFAGTRYAKHDVIGDEALIKTFPREQFVEYWNAWYRPENMTLIVAGDIEVDAVIAKAKEKLGGLKARTPAKEASKAGIKPFESSRALVLTDAEQVTGDVTLMRVAPGRADVTTVEQYRQEIVEGVGEWIVNRRFADLVAKGGAPFRGAAVGSGRMFDEGMNIYASGEGEAKDWNKILDAVIAEVSRAIDHGFTERELKLARSAMVSSAQRAVKTESSIDSKQFVTRLAGQVGTRAPILSAEQRLELTKSIVEKLTTDELHKAFVENFKAKNYAYVLAMPAKKEGLTLPTEEEVTSAAAAAWARKAEAPAEVAEGGSILASEPAPGVVASKENDKDLDVTTVVFENGVVMHHKFSDYKKDSVLAVLTLPGGVIEETVANKGVSSVASLMVSRPATSRFTSTQLRDLLTGKNVSVGGGVGADALSLQVRGSPTDFPIGMQLVHAILTEGTIEQSAVDEWKKRQLQALESKKTNPQAKMGDAMAELVYGGDVRMSPMTEAIVNRQERSPAEAWFRRIASNAAIEVVVVGDMQAKEAIELVGKYVGSLPKRVGTFRDLDKLRKLDRKPGPYAKTVEYSSVNPKAVVMAGFMTCDDRDPDRRPLTLAGMVISERMIQRIRMKEQLVYSIRCQNRPGEVFDGTGMMTASSSTDPHNADKLAGTIVEMIKTFATDGPTADEVTTAKKQIANSLSSQMKEPEFWVSMLSDLRYRDRPIAEIKELPAIYETFTPDQVRDVVRKYASDEKSLRIEAVPEAATAVGQ